MKNVNGNKAQNVARSIQIIDRATIPQSGQRGRESFVTKLSFWHDLIAELPSLGRAQAIEVDLTSVQLDTGKPVLPTKLMNGIRYQLHKMGLTKKYHLLLRGAQKHLFIVDNETAAFVTA